MTTFLHYMKFLRRENFIYIFLAILISIILISIFNQYASGLRIEDKVDTESLSDLNNLAPTSTDMYKLYDVDAEYTIINYFSLDCIHCRRSYLLEDKMLSELRGKVNIIYRHNPLSSQPLSGGKAVISLCVRDLAGGSVSEKNAAYYNFIQNLYNKYNLYNASNVWVENIASKYVSSSQLSRCISDKKFVEYIDGVKLDNIINDIIYTPTLLIFRNINDQNDVEEDIVKYEYIKKYDGIDEKGIASIYKWLIKN